MLLKNKIALLIHGKFYKSSLEYIFLQIKKAKEVEMRNIIIYISAYESDLKDLEAFLNSTESNAVIIPCKGAFNPGFKGINDEIISVNTALNFIEEDILVIKMRSNQCVDFDNLYAELRKNDFLKKSKKLLATNCSTQKNRLYHLSNLFICGEKNELKLYYSLPLVEYTELDWQMYLKKIYIDDYQEYNINYSGPERWLFTNYLKKKGWSLKNTYMDTYEALSQYCVVVNSWNIKFRQIQQKKANCDILLPQCFWFKESKLGPMEYSKVYFSFDFDKKITIKDFFWIIYLYFKCIFNIRLYLKVSVDYIERLVHRHYKLKKIIKPFIFRIKGIVTFYKDR